MGGPMLIILLLCYSPPCPPPPASILQRISTQVEYFRFPLQACHFLELPKSQLPLVKAPSRLYQRIEQMPITGDGIGWGGNNQTRSRYVRIETQVTFSSFLFVHPRCPQLTWQVYAWTSVCAQVRVCRWHAVISKILREKIL